MGNQAIRQWGGPDARKTAIRVLCGAITPDARRIQPHAREDSRSSPAGEASDAIKAHFSEKRKKNL